LWHELIDLFLRLGERADNFPGAEVGQGAFGDVALIYP
jgi:hypothetical protein